MPRRWYVSSESSNPRRVAKAQRAQRREALNRMRAITLKQLLRFGQQLMNKGQSSGNACLKPRWSINTLAAVERLLALYVFGSAEEIRAQELTMDPRVIDEVRRRVAGNCYIMDVHGASAASLAWYPGILKRARDFHDQRRDSATQRRA